MGPCTKSLNPSQPGREHAEKMIPHPIEAPLGLGSMEDGWIWVLGFGVRNERGRAREGELRELGRVSGSLGVRERFKCCGAQNS